MHTYTQWLHGMGNQHNRQSLIMMLIFFWSTFPILCLQGSYSPAQWKQPYSNIRVQKLLSFASCIVSMQNHDHSMRLIVTQLVPYTHTLCCSLALLCEDVYLIFHTTIQYCTAIIRIQVSLHEVMRRLHGTLWCDYVHKAIIAWSITACR